MKGKNKTKVPGIYDVPECEGYRTSKADRMKKLNYISFHMKGKPNLEDFVNINDFNSVAIGGEFKETENPSYYYNSKLKILLQYVQKNTDKPTTIIGEPVPRPGWFRFDEFTVFGKPTSILKYLKTKYPETHLRLYNYLKYGIDTEQVRKALDTPGSSAYIEAFENLTKIKIRPKEE